MENMITKELLSEVIGYAVTNVKQSTETWIELWTCDHVYADGFNIYELAHKCKEWAWSSGYSLSSTKWTDTDEEYSGKWDAFIIENYYNVYMAIDQYHFLSDTEPEAIFKACQWILDNKGVSNGRAQNDE